MARADLPVKFWLILALLWVVCPARWGYPRSQWQFSLAGGVSTSLPTQLRISQQGYPEMRFAAQFATRPLQFPLYYSARLGATGSGQGWEVELIHLKLYLQNPPAAIQRFDVTHGFNLFLLNRVQANFPWQLRIGAGTVIAHPENTVRQQALPENRGIVGTGYYLSGMAVQLALQRIWPVADRWALYVEGKFTLARAGVPVVEGKARFTSVALQFLVGWRFSLAREPGG